MSSASSSRWLLLGCCLLFLYCCGTHAAADLSYALVDADGQPYQYSCEAKLDSFRIYWTLRNDTIDIGIQVDSQGWVCLGFDAEDKSHKNADYIVALLGNVVDYWSIKQDTPRTDVSYGEEDDLIRINGSTAVVMDDNGWQVVRFRRNFVTGHPLDKPIGDGDNIVVWAYGPSQDIDDKHEGNARDWLMINFQTGICVLPNNVWPVWTPIVAFVLSFLLIFVCVHYVLPLRILHPLARWIHLPKVVSFHLYDILFLLFWIAVNVVWYIGYEGKQLDAANKIAMLMQPNILMLMFSAVRNSIWQLTLSIPFERAIMYHRWVGYLSFIIMSIHGFWWIVIWIFDGDLLDQLLESPNIWGVIAYFLAIAIVVTATVFIRRKMFELFYYMHFNFIFFLVFTCLHADDLIPYIAAGGVLYAADLVIRIYRSEIKSTELVSVKAHKDMIRLDLKQKGFMYAGGQYAFLKIRDVSWIQSHPFSISSAPGDETITFHIKTFGGWTKKLSGVIGEGKNKLHISLNGGYGGPPPVRIYNTICLFATGSGAAPWISVMRDLLNNPIERHSVASFDDLVYHTKKLLGLNGHSVAHVEDGNIKLVPSKVYFYWIIRHEDYLSWFEDTFNAMSEKGDLGVRFEVHVWVTHAAKGDYSDEAVAVDGKAAVPATGDDPEVEMVEEEEESDKSEVDKGNFRDRIHMHKGRPDFKDLFTNLVKSHEKVDSRILTCVCGPTAVKQKIKSYSQRFSNAHLLFDCHSETFEF